jgi:hypothetical protein
VNPTLLFELVLPTEVVFDHFVDPVTTNPSHYVWSAQEAQDSCDCCVPGDKTQKHCVRGGRLRWLGYNVASNISTNSRHGARLAPTYYRPENTYENIPPAVWLGSV